MKNVKINDKDYEIIKDEKGCFDIDSVNNIITDYFDDYDYILGDFSYDKLRLKGFCKKENKLFNKVNDINYLDEYLEKYCSFGAKYFLLEKIK